MEIKVGNYILRSDRFCMWLEEKYTDKKGKDATRMVAGYCTSFKQLLDDFTEKKIKGTDAKTMKELLAVMEQTLDDIEAMHREAVKKDFKIIRGLGKES